MKMGNKELLSEKKRHLSDLEECAKFKKIRDWIWVGATIRRLKEEIKELEDGS